MEVSHKESTSVFSVCIPSGKRQKLCRIRGSMTITTWTDEADAMSNEATSLKRQRGRRSTSGGINYQPGRQSLYLSRNKEIEQIVNP